MKKSIEGRVPGHQVDKLKGMAVNLAQQGEDEPMDKALETVLAAGFDRLENEGVTTQIK